MTNNHGKTKGRRDEGRYCAIPLNVMDSESFRTLSGNATKMLFFIYRQFNGRNNGDLSAPFSKAASINIGSQSTWYKAIKELIAANLIMVTRESMKKHQGNPHGLCTLFAVTWKKIDECNSKINCSPTLTPPRKFSLDAKY
jgi:hypothetical protein